MRESMHSEDELRRALGKLVPETYLVLDLQMILDAITELVALRKLIADISPNSYISLDQYHELTGEIKRLKQSLAEVRAEAAALRLFIVDEERILSERARGSRNQHEEEQLFRLQVALKFTVLREEITL